MDITYPSEAIILKRNDYREYDSRVKVYSLEHGILDLLVRGTKRPKSKLAAHVEPINQVSIMVIKGKNYNYVGSARANRCYHNIKSDLETLSTASVAIRLVNKLLEPGIADEKIYYLLQSFLEFLDNSQIDKNTSQMYLCFFVLKFIYQLGYSPNMEQCNICGKRHDDSFRFFSYETGSLICNDCARDKKEKLSIRPGTIKIMQASRDGFSKDRCFLSNEAELEDFKKVINIYIKYIFNFDLGLI